MIASLLLLLAGAAETLPLVEGVPAPAEEFCVECCSLYCAAVPTLSVSRHLESQHRLRYGADRLEDGLASTAWVVDALLGEWFQFVFEPTEYQHLEPTLGVDSLYIMNGYRKSPEHWRDHARIRELELLVDGTARARLLLLDTPTPQRLELPRIPLHAQLTLRFVVRGVYSGDRFQELAVSEVRVDGYGHH